MQDLVISKLYYIKKTEKQTKVFLLEISKEKKIKFSDISHTKTAIEYSKYYDSSFEAIIEDFEGNINLISKTSLYPIVDFQNIYKFYNSRDQNLKTFSMSLKNDKSAYPLVRSMHYLKSFTQNSEYYYSVGMPNNSNSFSTTSPFRKISIIEGNLIEDKILSSLNIYFVKNKDYTVVPYPLKYIREKVDLDSLI